MNLVERSAPLNKLVSRFEAIATVSNFYWAFISIIRFFLKPAIHWEKLVVLERRQAQSRGSVRDEKFFFFDLESEREDRLSGFGLREDHRDLLKKKISQGKTITLATDNKRGEKVVAFGYSDYNNISISGLNMKMSPHTLFQDYALTLPEARGRGIHSAMLDHIFMKSVRRGYQRCLVTVLHYNRSSLRSHIKAGFQEIGVIRSYMILRRLKIVVFEGSIAEIL